jgi:hypothetical protein
MERNKGRRLTHERKKTEEPKNNFKYLSTPGFDVWDLNKKGTISKEEFKKVY